MPNRGTDRSSFELVLFAQSGCRRALTQLGGRQLVRGGEDPKGRQLRSEWMLSRAMCGDVPFRVRLGG